MDATDPEGDPLDRSIDREPRHGRLLRVTGDTAEYVPTDGFVGVDSFTWTASDGESTSAPATVTIVVGNSAPTAADDRIEVDAGERVLIESAELLGNDDDADGDELELVGAYRAAGMAGEIERTDEGVEFTAPAGGDATAVFEYAVSDGRGGLGLAVVTVSISGEFDPGPTTSTTSTTVAPSTTSTTTTVAPSTTSTTTTSTTVAPSTTSSSTTSTTSTTAAPNTAAPNTAAPNTGDRPTAGAPEPSVASGGSNAPSVAADSTLRSDGGGSRSGAPRRLAITGVAILPLMVLGAGMVVLGMAALRSRRSTR